MIEGSGSRAGSGSIPLTSGSGFGTLVKNIQRFFLAALGAWAAAKNRKRRRDSTGSERRVGRVWGDDLLHCSCSTGGGGWGRGIEPQFCRLAGGRYRSVLYTINFSTNLCRLSLSIMFFENLTSSSLVHQPDQVLGQKKEHNTHQPRTQP